MMNLEKHLIVTIDELFINYEIVDSNNREWITGRERKSLDHEQCLQQLIQLIKHKHEHYILTEVTLTYCNIEIDQDEVRMILQNQINIPIK